LILSGECGSISIVPDDFLYITVHGTYIYKSNSGCDSKNFDVISADNFVITVIALFIEMIYKIEMVLTSAYVAAFILKNACE
jgi:hypothetical protein